MILSTGLGDDSGIWIGLGAAPILTAIISTVTVLVRYGRGNFPLLLPEEPGKRIYIYDFVIDPENAVKMSRTVSEILERHSLPQKTCMSAGLITEEALMLIRDKNKDARKPILAECTLITQPDGIKLILRDSGVIFDLSDTDGFLDSFRRYIFSSLMLKQESKLYMVTTGYNRNEFFFKSDRR